MRARLDRLWDKLRTSLWFVPGAMAVGAVALATISIAIDETIRPDSTAFFGWLYSGEPDGARAILATVAGTMATVAGVTFSITIVALTLASTQFGPRLLRNFMRDPANQFVLGTFIATFVYCLLILRTVRGREPDLFVPQLSVSVGLILAIFSLGVLIYFIHHVSLSIQADTVIGNVASECEAVIRKLLPDIGENDPDSAAQESPETLLERVKANGGPIESPNSGYIQTIDLEGLIALAKEHDLRMHVRCRPGDFLIAGAVMVEAEPIVRITEDIRKRIQATVALGTHRTPIQDIEFAINQLVEVASRALSPGVNDPFTAIACVDRLGAILAILAQRRFPSKCIAGNDGVVRLVSEVVTFRGAANAAFNQIRQYARTNVALHVRMLETIAAVAEFTQSPDDRAALLAQAEMLRAAARDAVPEERDRADIEERFDTARRALSTPERSA